MGVKRTTQAEFELFKREFLKWQRRLGLTDWKVYFEHVEVDDGFAEIIMDHEGCLATVRLTTKVPGPDVPDFDPAAHARHEALELLLGPVRRLMTWRYVVPDDINIEIHRVVRRLEKLLPVVAEDSGEEKYNGLDSTTDGDSPGGADPRQEPRRSCTGL